jgi:hypothetical protein
MLQENWKYERENLPKKFPEIARISEGDLELRLNQLKVGWDWIRTHTTQHKSSSKIIQSIVDKTPNNYHIEPKDVAFNIPAKLESQAATMKKVELLKNYDSSTPSLVNLIRASEIAANEVIAQLQQSYSGPQSKSSKL